MVASDLMRETIRLRPACLERAVVLQQFRRLDPLEPRDGGYTMPANISGMLCVLLRCRNGTMLWKCCNCDR